VDHSFLFQLRSSYDLRLQVNQAVSKLEQEGEVRIGIRGPNSLWNGILSAGALCLSTLSVPAFQVS
jgi:hypothetical protein